MWSWSLQLIQCIAIVLVDDSLGDVAADQVCYVSVLHWSQIPYTVFLSTELCWGRLLEKVFHALETGDISKLPP